MMQPNNWSALIVAAAAAWIFGAIWYGVLGKIWIAAQGRTMDTLKVKNAGKSAVAKGAPLAISFVSEVGIAAAVSEIMVHSAFNTARQGAIAGALCWLGFVLTTVL